MSVVYCDMQTLTVEVFELAAFAASVGDFVAVSLCSAALRGDKLARAEAIRRWKIEQEYRLRLV